MITAQASGLTKGDDGHEAEDDEEGSEAQTQGTRQTLDPPNGIPTSYSDRTCNCSRRRETNDAGAAP